MILSIKTIRIPFTWASPKNEVKGNRSVEKLGKVNPAILYRNELDPKKQTITQELYGLKLPVDYVSKSSLDTN